MTKGKSKARSICYTYQGVQDALLQDIPEGGVVVFVKHVCPWELHRWKLEEQEQDVFVAVCEVCGKRALPSVILEQMGIPRRDDP